MDISIITVTWNSEKHIAEQIRSVISACSGISFEQIVVDNGSGDGTIEIIEKNFPSVKFIKNNHNAGFGIANNQAVKMALGEYVLFLNPDMRLTDGSLAIWLKWMGERPKVGISGCRLVTEDGGLNLEAMPRRFPLVWDQLLVILKIPHVFPSVLNHYLYRDKDFSKEQNVDSLRGSCMLVRHELIEKLGYAFDPRYYIWFEDVDLCREAKRLGFEVAYTPIVSATDAVGKSFKKRNVFWKQFQLIQSMLKYFWKWK
ncbi:MAG: glycosyltransferase family 2 protein [Candidatus Magasanikbacteria bacterium]|nr:glycosyltransferase family 2 protein [Candidatus Magasanikbacteria bacterium]